MTLRTTLKSHFSFAIGIPALVWQIIFFYIPLVFIVFSSVVKVSMQGEFEGFTFSHIRLFLTPVYLKVIGFSLLLAFVTALICFLIAYPLAYFLAFTGKRFKSLFLFLLIVPFWTNFLLHVYAWFYVLERHGFLNNILLSLGFIDTPIRFLNSIFAIMVMMVYYYLPFMVLPIYASLERFDFKLIEASQDLGAKWFSTFRRIMLPLTLQGIRAGFFLVFIPSFGEFAIPELMGGDRIIFVGNVVSQYILSEGTGSLGSAFTLVSGIILLIVAISIYFLSNSFLKRKVHHA